MLNSKKITLVTGASSSGKSEFAEVLAAKTNKTVIYVATAKVDATDREWQTKIRQHQRRRPQNWQTLEVSDQLFSTIDRALSSECLLIDSLGTWVANFLILESLDWKIMNDRLLESLKKTQAKVILVSEETGWGVVPAYPLGRIFRDRLGFLSRKISNLADTTAYLVVGGHILNLSLLGEPLSNYEI